MRIQHMRAVFIENIKEKNFSKPLGETKLFEIHY